jgi:hypothetical protein
LAQLFAIVPHVQVFSAILAADATVVRLPSQLRTRDLNLYECTHIQTVINAIGQLQHLSYLDLDCSYNLSPLAQASQLAKLHLPDYSKNAIGLTEEQMLPLKQMHQLRELHMATSTGMTTWFALPHQLQITKISAWVNSAADAEALANLPSLTCLEAHGVHASHAGFLRHLPVLSKLTLSFDTLVDTCRTITDLRSCVGLTYLHLFGDGFPFTSEMLGNVFQYMPQLATLELNRTTVTSLAGTLNNTLTSLYLNNCSLIPRSELPKVHALLQLHTLVLFRRSFADSLNNATLQNYKPPSRLLPRLQAFYYY